MSPPFPSPSGAEIQVRREPNGVFLRISGRLDSRTIGGIWREAERALRGSRPASLVVDAAGIDYCDVSGVGLLVSLRRGQETVGGEFAIRGLKPGIQRLLELFGAEKFRRLPGEERRRRSVIIQIGRATVEIWHDLRDQIVFMGHLTVSLTRILGRRQKIRWKDTIRVVEAAGVDAFPIVSLVGFTMGLVIAFQAGMALRRFAAEIYVVDSVVVSMFKEIGPFFTAIVLAGRSGSAFAAELGTMKVNEEVDALETMGLDPVPFLAIPRVLAGVFVAPLLTLFANLAGLIGGGLVFLSFGFNLSTYVNRLLLRGEALDLYSGLFKSLIFGVIVAAVGCLEGLRTGTGARAVGESTTRSVVAAIVLVVIADGVLGTVFFFLGI